MSRGRIVVRGPCWWIFCRLCPMANKIKLTQFGDFFATMCVSTSNFSSGDGKIPTVTKNRPVFLVLYRIAKKDFLIFLIF
jgi:hypothetical protein